MNKVVCTDLDGTLFYPKKRLQMFTKENRAFLRQVKANGDRVVLVTSRHLSFIKRVEKKLGFSVDCVGCDGGFVLINDRIVSETTFDPTALKNLVKDLREQYNPPLFLLATRDHSFIMTKTLTSHITTFMYFAYEAVQGVYRERCTRSDHVFYNEIEKGASYKLMMMVGLTKKKKAKAEQITAQLTEQYPQFNFMWLGEMIEITPKGCSKADGLAFYLDFNKISHDNVHVVGDSGNDVPMFDRFHEHSYCMSHSPDSVKAHAAHVIHRVSDLKQVLYPSEDSQSE